MNIEIGGLRCVTAISSGDNYMRTELINDQIMGLGSKVKFNHPSFSNTGRDMEKLQEILNLVTLNMVLFSPTLR